MSKKIFITLVWVLFYFFIFLFLLKNSYGYLDADLGWHLAVGNEILTEKQVPHINTYNYTIKNQSWVDHEWLMNAFMSWLYTNGGYLALTIFFVLVVVLFLIILILYIKKYFINQRSTNFFILLLMLLGVIAMAPHLGIRVQEITLFNLVILLLIIRKFEITKKTRVLWWLLPLFYFWANTHGGFLMGLFILFFFVAVKFIEIILSKFEIISCVDFSNKINLKNLAVFSAFTFLSIGITLLTPYGPGLYEFLSGYTDTFYLTHIEKWVPANWYPIQYWQFIYAAVVVVVLILTSFFASSKLKPQEKNRTKINIWFFSLALLFLYLSFKSKRHFPLLFVTTFPYMVSFFSQELEPPKSFFNNFFTKKTEWLKIFLKSLIITCLTLVIAAQILNTNFIKEPFSNYCNDYPCEATQFIKNSQYRDLKLFNQYGWGGYLIWDWPGKELFVDGRLPQYQFAGHTLLQEYFYFFDKNELADKLNQYDIEAVFIRNNYPQIKLNWFEKYFLFLDEELINSTPNYLRDYLASSPDWQPAFENDLSIVYVKK